MDLKRKEGSSVIYVLVATLRKANPQLREGLTFYGHIYAGSDGFFGQVYKFRCADGCQSESAHLLYSLVSRAATFLLPQMTDINC